MESEGFKRTIFPGLIERLCNADRRHWRHFGHRGEIPIGDFEEWFRDYCTDPCKYIMRGGGAGHGDIQNAGEKPGEGGQGETPIHSARKADTPL